VRPSFELSKDRNDRRFRSILAWSLVGSAVVHVGLFLGWRQAPGSARSAGAGDPTVPRSADRSFLRAVRLPTSAASRQIVAPPPPIAVRHAPRISAPRYEPGAAVAVSLVRPALAEPGSGTAGEEAAGAAGRFERPAPTSVYPPWDPPRSAVGTAMTVRMWVDSAGHPCAPVVLSPPTSDPDFNRRLRHKLLLMSFRPARVDGRPVAAWAELVIRF